MIAIESTRLATSTGSQVQEQMARMKARLVARYKLAAVPGRAEELVSIELPQRGVSLGYGCKTIRVRAMVGRDWVDHADFQIGEGWGSDLYALLDSHFHFLQRPSRSLLLPITSDDFPRITHYTHDL